MKAAIQQPYFYPYIGYFKLISSTDVFLLFDDVQYIRRGWVNRNRISENLYLTVPVEKSKRNSLINKIKIDYSSNWHYKHCRTLQVRYGKKVNDHPIYLFYKLMPRYIYLVDLLEDSLKNVCNFLNIKTKITRSSKTISINPDFKKQDRIIEICKKINCNHYMNLPGGKKLYCKENFLEYNIQLDFIETKEITNYFSILDLCLGEGLEKI